MTLHDITFTLHVKKYNSIYSKNDGITQNSLIMFILELPYVVS